MTCQPLQLPVRRRLGAGSALIVVRSDLTEGIGSHRWPRHWYRQFCRWWFVVIGRGVQVRLGEFKKLRGEPPEPELAMEICELRVTVEEEQVGIQKFSVPTEQPDQQLHRRDIQPQTTECQEARHGAKDCRTAESSAPRATTREASW